MEPICYVVGAGVFSDSDAVLIKERKPEDILIAADGGYASLINIGIVPDGVIGDFDSLEDTLCDFCDNNSVTSGASKPFIQRLNPIKDITDMQAAINCGIQKDFKSFYIFGGCGMRIDHTIANIQLMSDLAVKGYSVKMFDAQNILTVIHNDKIYFDESKKGFVSVFSLSNNSYGVFEEGLKYTLDNATLTNSFALGVSNEFTNKKSSIRVLDGTLLIITSR